MTRTRVTIGRPRGTGLPVAALAAKDGKVNIRVRLPRRLLDILADRKELSLAAHVRVALTRALETGLPPLDEVELGEPWQVKLPNDLLQRIENAYGVAQREASIITAVAAYVDETIDRMERDGGNVTRGSR